MELDTETILSKTSAYEHKWLIESREKHLEKIDKGKKLIISSQ